MTNAELLKLTRNLAALLEVDAGLVTLDQARRKAALELRDALDAVLGPRNEECEPDFMQLSQEQRDAAQSQAEHHGFNFVGVRIYGQDENHIITCWMFAKCDARFCVWRAVRPAVLSLYFKEAAIRAVALVVEKNP